jgi:Fe2+ transport system protein FeoA
MKEERCLSSLQPGDRGRVKKVSGEGNLKRKLLDMGIIPGVVLEVVKLAPLGDPIEIKIRGYNLSLRKDEAGRISVEVEE